jgi:hypothetical protein
MSAAVLTRSPRFWLALVLVGCLGLVSLALPVPSQAQTGRCGHEFDYYDDATYTNQIGMRYWGCPPFCTYAAWGSTSSYVIIWDLGCSGGY